MYPDFCIHTVKQGPWIEQEEGVRIGEETQVSLFRKQKELPTLLAGWGYLGMLRKQLAGGVRVTFSAKGGVFEYSNLPLRP